MEINRASPRQADLMIVAGRVSRKMAPVMRQLYDQMSDPKWVIAMGDCASCGGVYNNYAVVQGVDEIIPVDVYIAGCPPRPEALIHGIMTLHEKVRREKMAPRKKMETVRCVAPPTGNCGATLMALENQQVLDRMQEQWGDAVIRSRSEYRGDLAITLQPDALARGRDVST